MNKKITRKSQASVVAKNPKQLAHALGLSASHAEEWQIQFALYRHLKEIVAAQPTTHAEIAKKAGTSRTKITAILNGNLEHVSSDLLVRILAALNYKVRVSVHRTKAAA